MISVDNLSFKVGHFCLSNTSLTINDGEYFALLGPPGSGKSIFLELLCGLNLPDTGSIQVAGKDVTHKDPCKRGIGYVPQDYALFPHFSVADNISYGLRWKGISKDEITKKTHTTASLLGIGHLLERCVNGLSGGEKQRTALARALAIEPSVLLLDEPVSALDENTRESVCSHLRQLQAELGVTTIHVSHNLEEAFSVADRGSIINQGVFQQIGLLKELLRKPANEFVARFMRCGNIFKGTAQSRGQKENTTQIRIEHTTFIVQGRFDGQVQFVIRPENICISSAGDTVPPHIPNQFQVSLTRKIDRGSYMRLELQGEVPLIAHLPLHSCGGLNTDSNTNLTASFAPEAIHILPA